jgi:hypothetical protein
MKGKISRRQFLKISALAFGAGTLNPSLMSAGLPYESRLYPAVIGRVASPAIYLYSGPSFESERVGVKRLDTLLSILEEVQSSGPGYNPLWYRLSDGYAHSGRIQRIDLHPPNPLLESIPTNGLFGEITVPYVRSFRITRGGGWQPLYRLYHQSVHWVRGIDEGPDGAPWYRLQDTLLGVHYHVPASTVRKIDFRDYSPTARKVPSQEKRIVISISSQTLTAYEGDLQVLHTTVSSGVHSETVEEGDLPTDTPTGNFHIQFKTPSRHMGDGNLTDDIEAYELPGVPWTMVFHETGVALHGTYWHNNFGTRMSHGCVNLRNADAKWLFRWTEPAYYLQDWYVMGYGTLVQVVE